MDIYVDATTLIALESVGELELLTNFDGDVMIPPRVLGEITDERADRNVQRLLRRDSAFLGSKSGMVDKHHQNARAVLGDEEANGDVAIITAVLRADEMNEPIAVVSDDQRVRTVADEFGATVTGTIGVVVRAVYGGMDSDDAKSLVRRLDSNGLHMTGELRETAYRLIDEAAEEN
ncbi:PIN domain-containing protein [Halobellus salinisoli]|uniref:PIN domain-containing protein n=1 Tax=Halobellus salinisoli TaxID=3108500 RepID=UPI0030099645